VTLTTRARGQVKGSKSICKHGLVEGFIYLLSRNQIGLKQYKLEITNNKKTIKKYKIYIDISFPQF